MKKLTLIIALISLFITCKSEKKKNIDEEPNTKGKVSKTTATIKENTILKDGGCSITFEGVFEKDDLFLIYYSTGPKEKISTENTFRKDIKGSPNLQKITFYFLKENRPYALRVDFSDKKIQKSVKFSKLIIKDNYNTMVINNNNISNFFDFNRHSKHDKDVGLLIGEVYDVNSYNPYFVSNKILNKHLKAFNDASINKINTNLIDDIYNVDFNDGRLRMLINGIFEKDDLVILFYAEDSIERFDINKTIRKQIKGSNKPQTIVFTLPQDVFMAKARLDISDRKTQTNIDVASIIFNYKTDEIEINKTNLSKYFFANNYIDLNKDTGVFSCKTITENNIIKYNPYFISTPRLVEELLNL